MRDLSERLYFLVVHVGDFSAQRAKRVNALVIRIMIHDGVSPNKPVCR